MVTELKLAGSGVFDPHFPLLHRYTCIFLYSNIVFGFGGLLRMQRYSHWAILFSCGK